MAEDWAADVRKYAPDAEDGVIAAIVRYCGIALQNRDSSLVSFSEKTETDRVRDNYCRKKLGLTQSDEELDSAIAAVGARMNQDTTRNRVTVYYLLAEHFGKLGLFGATTAATAAAAAPVSAATQPVMSAPQPALSNPPPAPQPAPAAVPTAAQTLAAAPLKDDGNIVRTGLIAVGALATILIGAGVIGTVIGQRIDTPAIAPPPAAAAPYAPAATAATAATAAAEPAAPQGAGVVKVVLLGLPRLSVYFDTARSDVTPEFDAAAADIKAYADANPDARFDVSGYNDPRGDAAMNAELSKARAIKVAAALVALGIAQNRIDLEKPPETTDATTTMENARRVDVFVEGSPAG
jgi:outer membrane protein OmpA-like peptidoglycan-associated protein